MSDISVIHRGRVTEVSPESVTIRLYKDTGNCSGCSVSFFCSNSGEGADTVVVPLSECAPDELAPGDEVNLSFSESSKLGGAFILFAVPSILLAASVLIVICMNGSDGLAVASGLAVIVIYFIVLYFLRKSLMRKFRWTFRGKVL